MEKNKINSLFPYLLACLCGASLTLGYAPYDIWLIVPPAIVGFLLLLSSSDHPFKLGITFGLGWFGAGISWVHVSIADFGGLPLVASLGLMLLLCLYLACYPALAAWLLRRYFPLNLWPVTLPFIWLVTESLRGWVLTGFPWLSLGYSQLPGPLSGWFPIIGETGASLLIVAMSASLACGIKSRSLVAPALLTGVLMISGYALNTIQWTQDKGTAPLITMVQGNIHQELRWVPEQDWPTMKKYLDYTEQHLDSDIIIWPEAAIPKLEPLAEEYIHHVDQLALENQTGIITGIANYNFETREAFNNLIALGQSRTGQKRPAYRYFHNNRYAKHHLLPIGEFIPLENWLRGLAPIFDLPMSSFSRGDYVQKNLLANNYHIAPAICFEIAFPHQINANLHSETDFILTVSNDAWFGDSHGPDQHLQIAQVRAKEFSMPVLRATNNGITAFIDHRGQIVSRAPQFEEATLSERIRPQTGSNPFRQFGDSISWATSLLLLGFALYRKRALTDQ